MRVGPASEDAGVVRNSMILAVWTAASRVTGLVRVAVVAAVFGPSFLGNLFVAANNIPVLLYALLTGSLFGTLLVPPLVRHLDRGDQAAAQRLAGGFLGVILAVFGAVTLIVVVGSPLVLRMLTLGVDQAEVVAAQRSAGIVLLTLFVPQLLLYGIAATGEAALAARGRFALAAAAPVLENIGLIATVGIFAALRTPAVADVDTTMIELLVLGIGATSAVGLHAGVKWWGARRIGIHLVPQAGWRIAEVRAIIRRAVPSLGYAGLDAALWFGTLVIANRVPGGVVAFSLATSFYLLPTALVSRSISVALLPRLSRLFEPDTLRDFRDELVRGAALIACLVIPAVVAYIILAEPLADAVSFGSFSAPHLIALPLAALAPGILGSSMFLLGTYALHAQYDTRSTFKAMSVRAVVGFSAMILTFLLVDGAAVLLALGLSISSADLAGALYTATRLRRGLPRSKERLWPAAVRSVLASSAMAVPAYLLAVNLPPLLPATGGAQLAVLLAAVVGAVVFVCVQKLCSSPELDVVLSGLPRTRRRPDGSA